MKLRILVVEDDPTIGEIIKLLLGAEGFDVKVCANGLSAPGMFYEYRPDLVLLDLMLPGMDGISLCRVFRDSSSIPIIMLTARSDSSDVVAGLEAGADDYVIKPFRNEELVARVRARIRRVESQQQEKLYIGDLVIDTAAHEVYRGKEILPVTPLEFDLLVCIAKRPGQAVTRSTLLREVWGYTHESDTRLVNVHVQRLRAKVEHDQDDPKVVLTVRGVGYRAGAVSQ